jgi:hypothetical protein
MRGTAAAYGRDRLTWQGRGDGTDRACVPPSTVARPVRGEAAASDERAIFLDDVARVLGGLRGVLALAHEPDDGAESFHVTKLLPASPVRFAQSAQMYAAPATGSFPIAPSATPRRTRG